MGTLHFLRPAKNPLRLVLVILSARRMDSLILCLRSLERFTDLDKFKRIYILISGGSPERLAIARHFERRRDNAAAIDCRPGGPAGTLADAENAIIEQHAGDVVIKLEEDAFVTPHWLEHMLDGYQSLRRNPKTPVITPLTPVSPSGRRILNRFLKYAFPAERGMFQGPPVMEDWVYHRWIWRKIMKGGLIETYLAQKPPAVVLSSQADANCILYDRRLMELIHPLPPGPDSLAPDLTAPGAMGTETPSGQAAGTAPLLETADAAVNRVLRENGLRAAVMGRSVVHRYAYPACEDYLRAYAPLDEVWGYLDEVRVPRFIAPAKPPVKAKGRPVLTLLRSPG